MKSLSLVDLCAALTPGGVVGLELFEHTVTGKCLFKVTIAQCHRGLRPKLLEGLCRHSFLIAL
jgi:hypothetical protein